MAHVDPEYNAASVDQMIRSSRKPIAAGEADLIHSLLRGRRRRAPLYANTLRDQAIIDAYQAEQDQ